jgi:transposase
MEIPRWVLKHKKEGTEIHVKKSGYYLYKVTSKRDPVKKRPKKITEKYLGVITQEGVIQSKHERIIQSMKNITTKEFGATWFILENNKDIMGRLRTLYPHAWREILVFSVFRLLYNSPIKNLLDHYSTSFISETINNARMSPKRIGDLLYELGKEREKIKMFLHHFILGTKFAVIDLTHVFSFSENIISATLGYNSEEEFIPQVNLVFIFSLDNHSPAYFRMIPGSVRDVSSLLLTVKESEVENVVLIGDKGFYSEDNVKDLGELRKEIEKKLENLEEGGIRYIFPLKRNISLIDYGKLKKGDRREFDGFFKFEKRAIWHYSYSLDEKKKIVVYLDEKLKAEEEKDYLLRIEDDDKKSLEKFFEKQYTIGTISVITDLQENAARIYELLKCRIEIENLIDTFKNVLNADRTYMRDDYQMEGWMFINFIALVYYYRIYRLLVNNKLLNNYSPHDVLIHFSRIHKLKIGDKWLTSEIPKKTRKIIEKLSLRIT